MWDSLRLRRGAKRLLYLGVVAPATLISGFLLVGRVPSPERPAAVQPDLIFVEAPVTSPARSDQRFPEGSRLARLEADGTVEILTTGFFAAADPQVSFDSTRVLFAAKKERTSPWQVWEMDLDTSRKRQLTRCEHDCLQPAYLPHDEIVYTAVQPDDPTLSSRLYVSKGDGSDPHAITFGPGDFLVETVLQDGRILVSASGPLTPASGSGGTRELYTLRPDGTGLSSFRCDHRPGILRGEAAELGDGAVMFVKKHSIAEAGGALAIVRRGALHNSLINPTPGLYQSPRPWEAGRVVVAVQKPARRTGRFDLYSFDVTQGRVGEPLFADPTLSSLEPVPLSSRTPPRWYWSTLTPQLNLGYFICLNSHLSMDAPGGRFSADISKVRVFALNARSGSERNLGEANVEPDGSFYIAVPPDQPVRFELLDAKGKSVRAQRSWIWARSGEEHGCAGCHEDKAVAPENTWPQALRRFDTPRRLGVGSSVSAH